MKDLEAPLGRRFQGSYLIQNSPSHLVAAKTQAQSSVSAAWLKNLKIGTAVHPNYT